MLICRCAAFQCSIQEIDGIAMPAGNMNRRQRGTKRDGTRFAAATVKAVWKKGRIVPGYDPNVYRQDACGAWMKKSAHGETTEYGWEIDHIQPVALGGSDSLLNLQPLHWMNNRHKSDRYPNWSCAVS